MADVREGSLDFGRSERQDLEDAGWEEMSAVGMVYWVKTFSTGRRWGLRYEIGGGVRVFDLDGDSNRKSPLRDDLSDALAYIDRS